MNENNQKVREADDKLKALLANWIEKEVQLAFHLRCGETLKGKLLYYAKYEYVVQVADDKPAVVILKHAVDWIEKAPEKSQVKVSKLRR
ncbi:MAG: hypothetical protein ACTSXC_07285 [Candidatus Freyarchaeota archaeon]